MEEEVRRLANSLNNEDGVPEATYKATLNLVYATFGREVSSQFARAVDAVDGMFFLKEDFFK